MWCCASSSGWVSAISETAALQHLGNALMVLLARALQERLIGGILDEGVLEDVPSYAAADRAGRPAQRPPTWLIPCCNVVSSTSATAWSNSYENSRPRTKRRVGPVPWLLTSDPAEP